MSFTVNLPPSVVAKQVKSEQDSDEPKKTSREDWRKMKELEEMRKAGTAPAMQDEEGKDINPHIPQYIMQVPWYYGEDAATLKHQRPQPEKQKQFSDRNEWFKKGVKEGPVATKFRKGACENCGAMTHKKKDCLERPRKVGAKYTGDNFAPDEHIQSQLLFDYEGKRDRWNGYNPEEHQRVYEEYEKIEEAKRLLKEQKVETDLLEGEEFKDEKKKSGEDSDDDEDKYTEDVDMPGQKFVTKERITVRNLRIREDTAKYLFNLDPNSAYYDPKTRSMRENPYKNSGKTISETGYQGDNFVRYSGDAQNFAKRQIKTITHEVLWMTRCTVGRGRRPRATVHWVIHSTEGVRVLTVALKVFAWDAYEHGTDVHIQADPTKLELLSKEVVKRKEDSKTSAKDSILQKYGGEEHLEAPPKQLLMAQTEDYVEYSRSGAVVKGAEKPVVRSKYAEDVYINNHTSVWGSYWKNGCWGFKCCASTIKESYCTGQAGIEAQSERNMIALDEVGNDDTSLQKSMLEEHQERMREGKKKKKKKKTKHKKKKKRSSSSSESDLESDDSGDERKKEKKLKKALMRELESQEAADKLLAMDERKRPYNSMFEAKAPTEEELEAWRMKRQRMEDPMSAFS